MIVLSVHNTLQVTHIAALRYTGFLIWALQSVIAFLVVIGDDVAATASAIESLAKKVTHL